MGLGQWREGSQADVQPHHLLAQARRLKPIEQPVIKMQPRRRRRNGCCLIAGKPRLIMGLVEAVCLSPPCNIGRQRHLPMVFERVQELVSGAVEFERKLPVFFFRQNLRREALADLKAVADIQPLARPRQRLPLSCLQRLD